jgi:hypothetical protein
MTKMEASGTSETLVNFYQTTRRSVAVAHSCVWAHLSCTYAVPIYTHTFFLFIQGYSKRSIHFQKFILQKILTLNPCSVCGWKGNLSSSDIDDLKRRITEAVAAVTCDMLRRV